jgi:hypothetical protein
MAPSAENHGAGKGKISCVNQFAKSDDLTALFAERNVAVLVFLNNTYLRLHGAATLR